MIRGGRARRRRGSGAGLLATGLLLAAAVPVLTAPAQAAAACQGAVTSAFDVQLTIMQASSPGARQCTPAPNSTLTGTWSVSITAASIDLLSDFTVSIVPAKTGIPALGPDATVSRHYCALAVSLVGGDCPNKPTNSDSIGMTWDTGKLTPYNGVYEITTSATSLLGDQASASVTGLMVNNPPGAPSGVTAALAGPVPVVYWAPNPEPDITGYKVLRSSGGGYTQVGTATSPAFDDTGAPQGSPLTYEVVAVRASPVTPGGIASAASAPSNAVTPGATPVAQVALPSPKPAALPKVAVAKPPTLGSAEIVPQVDNTFAPTLPFGQAIPTDTALPALPTTAPRALAADPAAHGATTAAKVRDVAAALVLLILAFFVVRLARNILRSDQ
jgi:hypothetical protein